MKLLVISDVPHYQVERQVRGWAPIVREVDALAVLFDEVRHLGMLHSGEAPAVAIPYGNDNVSFIPLMPSGGKGLAAKLNILLRAPGYLAACAREFRWADVVYVRAPSNLSLLALLLLWAMRVPAIRWAKYAGNWRPAAGEPFSYKLQRLWLSKGLHRGLVTISGRWPNQPAHIHSFLNPCLTDEEVFQARLTTRRKKMDAPLRLLFAGRLSAAKGASRALRILAELRDRGQEATLDVAGDGPEMDELRELAARLGLTKQVTFHGWLSPAELRGLYQRAHFLVLPTSTEGFPKVVSEAMAHRCVPLAGAVSCIPEFLQTTGAGVALPPDDVAAFVRVIQALAGNPEAWGEMARRGQQAAEAFAYRAYIERVRALIGAWRRPKPPLTVSAAASGEWGGG